ncbi:MAG: HD domain-containing protein [Armatimonadota bacterium]|nr:HD domain-containing protein [Armatimonadota bacterium]
MMQTISPPVQWFTLAVIATAEVVLAFSLHQVSWQLWHELLLFYIVTVVAYSVRVPDPRGGAVTPSDVLSYLATYLFNPPTALLVVGTGRTLGYVVSRGWIPWRALLNGAQMGISVAIGALVFSALGGTPGHIDLEKGHLALVAAPLAHQAANNFFYAYSFSRWRGTSLSAIWLVGIRDLFWPNLLHIPTAIFLGILTTRVTAFAIVLYMLLLPFQWRALRLYLGRRQLYAQIVDRLVVAMDVDFPSSGAHARRVAAIAVAIAEEMRLGETHVEAIQFAALLHDVGLIGKVDLLQKHRFDSETSRNFEEHVYVGASIAQELPRKDIGLLVLHHHERYDGQGYPKGLKADAIPLGSRVIAVAEYVDSMRFGLPPYTVASEESDVIAAVRNESGRAFDPEVVDAFLRAVAKGLFVRLGEKTAFIP